MVLKLDVGQCVNEDVGHPIGVDCEISHRLEEQNISYKDVEASP